MSKIITLSIFLALIAACIIATPRAQVVSHHLGPECDATCALPALETKQVMSQDNWSLSVPVGDWAEESVPVPEIKLISKSQDQHCLLILAKETTADSFPEYVIGTVRTFAYKGHTITSIKQVVLHDTKFVLVQVNDDRSTVWDWIAVKDNVGYNFSCGGDIMPDAGASLHNLCQDIANTLVIK